MSKEAMKLALEALEAITVDVKTTPTAYEAQRQALTALRESLAEQPAQQEPVATVTSETGADISMSWWHEPALPVGTKLYTSPPAQRTWVGLSEEDREQHRNDWHSNIHDKEFRAIEAKLRSKNEDRN